MTIVIIIAAIGAVVLLVSILALSRSRFADESERFRYVSDLTSQWSHQQATRPADGDRATASAGSGGAGAVGAAGPAGAVEPPHAGDGRGAPIDLRDPERQSSRRGS